MLRSRFADTLRRPAAALPPTRVLKEIRLTGEPDATIGDQVKVDVFADGDKIDVVGKSKGTRFRRYDQTSQVFIAALSRTVR